MQCSSPAYAALKSSLRPRVVRLFCDRCSCGCGGCWGSCRPARTRGRGSPPLKQVGGQRSIFLILSDGVPVLGGPVEVEAGLGPVESPAQGAVPPRGQREIWNGRRFILFFFSPFHDRSAKQIVVNNVSVWPGKGKNNNIGKYAAMYLHVKSLVEKITLTNNQTYTSIAAFGRI